MSFVLTCVTSDLRRCLLTAWSLFADAAECFLLQTLYCAPCSGLPSAAFPSPLLGCLLGERGPTSHQDYLSILSVSIPDGCCGNPLPASAPCRLRLVTFELCVHWLISCLFFFLSLPFGWITPSSCLFLFRSFFFLSLFSSFFLTPFFCSFSFCFTFVLSFVLFWFYSFVCELLLSFCLHLTLCPFPFLYFFFLLSIFTSGLQPSSPYFLQSLHPIFFSFVFHSLTCFCFFILPLPCILFFFSFFLWSDPPPLHCLSLPVGGASLPFVRPTTSRSAVCTRSAPPFWPWSPWTRPLRTGSTTRQSQPEAPPPAGPQRLAHWSPLLPKPRLPLGRSGT